jgi:S-adenosylmethionine:tRNA ribosyltransferase-isomerase
MAFELPAELEASEPPEARGLARDEVRLMVSLLGEDRIEHTVFAKIGRFLDAGDLLVVNTSRTLAASLRARRRDGARVTIHFSSTVSDRVAVVELREPAGTGTRPLASARPGERLQVPGTAGVTLLGRHLVRGRPHTRLWLASLDAGAWAEVLARHGAPIRYGYVPRDWPLSCYQTVYARDPGSAEMPSAGRPFTRRILHDLVARRVALVPILLHTGVASLEAGEPPYDEFFRVPASTAAEVNARRAAGHRVIAVGTTAARALESVAGPDGELHPGEGWTDLVLSPDRPFRTVTGLLTGLHEPRATHLALLAALATRDELRDAYREALARRYLWHEFGDMHLMLRAGPAPVRA